MGKEHISKRDISAPLSESFKQLTPSSSLDSGMQMPEMPVNEPFFDASASQVGTPEHHMQQQRHSQANQRLSSRQLQSYVQAVAAYRRQIQAMSAASEMFARACEALKEVVPSAGASTQAYMEDLNLLIDSTHLISNSHQIWASNLGAEVEEPLVSHLHSISAQAGRIEALNKSKIEDLTVRLHREEDASYKLGKKKQRDLSTLQSSLTIRMSLAEEIKRLGMESQTVQDQLSNSSVEFVLKHCQYAISKELETYDTVMEGLKKLGAFDQRNGAASTILDSNP
ncbi:MAG: hypothetical protein SGCHY_001502 [Lobulomycetales sp.]